MFMSHEIITRFNIYVWSILIISIHFRHMFSSNAAIYFFDPLHSGGGVSQGNWGGGVNISKVREIS